MIVGYERDKHFSDIQEWAGDVRLDPNLLGSGLVDEGVCCCFVDGIGSTKAVLLYGLRTNPKVSVVKRYRSVLRIGRQIIEAAMAAGYTHGVATTSRSDVGRTLRSFGMKPCGDQLMMGVLHVGSR